MVLAEGGAGVLFIVLNHSGDVLSANMAMAMAQKQQLNVKMVLVHDDIACGPNHDDRRGLVGFLPVYKIAGAAAEAGLSLDTCLGFAERMQRNTRTLAVAVASATHPSTGQSIFDLANDEMEIGMGQHGEAGTGRMTMQTADKTTDLMLEMLLDDLKVQPGDDLLVIVNGAGATTLMELLIVFRRIHQVLQERKINLVRSKVGEFITTQEQGGFQLMISRMDSELIQLWDAPSNSPYFVTA
jgi:dihydroxyacetone kinase-like protein